jgi:heme exporter protein D
VGIFHELNVRKAEQKAFLSYHPATYNKTLKYTINLLFPMVFCCLTVGAPPQLNRAQQPYCSPPYTMEKLTEVLAQQLSMGGYAAYVWPSFAIATLVLAGMVVASVRELRKAQRALNDLKSLQSNET